MKARGESARLDGIKGGYDIMADKLLGRQEVRFE